MKPRPISLMLTGRAEHPVMSVKDLAQYLKVTRATIYKLVRRGELPAFRLGGEWRFNLESVEKWHRTQEKL